MKQLPSKPPPRFVVRCTIPSTEWRVFDNSKSDFAPGAYTSEEGAKSAADLRESSASMPAPGQSSFVVSFIVHPDCDQIVDFNDVRKWAEEMFDGCDLGEVGGFIAVASTRPVHAIQAMLAAAGKETADVHDLASLLFQVLNPDVAGHLTRTERKVRKWLKRWIKKGK